MNGQTNVQVTAIATLVVALLLGIGRYFMPEFIASLGSSFPEIFAGGMIAIIGGVLKPDAGIKSIPGTGTDVKSPAAVGVLAIILAAIAISGCAGTKAAYKAAEGLPETAYVVGEHYFALVREVNDMDDAGKLSSGDLRRLQAVALQTRPPVMALLDATSAYDQVRSADNQEALEAAMADAAVAISRLIQAIKAVGGAVYRPACIDPAPTLNRCALVAAN